MRKPCNWRIDPMFTLLSRKRRGWRAYDLVHLHISRQLLLIHVSANGCSTPHAIEEFAT